MNKWILPMVFIVFAVVVGAFALVQAQSSGDVQAEDKVFAGCGVEGGCPYAKQGGCTAGANCGASGCAAKTSGSCGCGG